MSVSKNASNLPCQGPPYPSCLSMCCEDEDSLTIFMLQLCVYFASQRGVFSPVYWPVEVACEVWSS